ncbi:ABC transporter permease [Oceanirhabdus sp. W0125-5]|uniref:ABC transporter permease n=1 Tax=Oceanirhabdus sp. W0125-5 TaxID=2999116 RepID=UPI0022F2D070|nr:ABC transporter permease [Oceanirhabdus sp. W0125-5]WBW95375.1 ABC transporter permease [Oceanirhabdus sp. W0125-5]
MDKVKVYDFELNENELDLEQSDFELLQSDVDIKDEAIQGKPIGFFKDAMIRFTKNKASLVAFGIIMFIIFMAAFGPSMNHFTFRQQKLEWGLLPPRVQGLEKLGIMDGTKVMEITKASMSTRFEGCILEVIEEYDKQYKNKTIPMVKAKIDYYKFKGAEDVYYWFGSDKLGRDLWTRVWRGARVSLFIGFVAAMVNMFIGVIYGAISGYYGGMVDMLMQRFIEILGGIPMLVVIILFIMNFGTGIIPIAMALVVTGWIGMSRMIRAQFYRYKRMEYVLASRTMGAQDNKLIFRHILPNAIGPIITQVTLAIPGGIATESFLAYLGLGVQAPEPSIGVLLSEGQILLLDFPHYTLFPAIIISALMIAFNLFSNGLRDAFDPTLRGQE